MVGWFQLPTQGTTMTRGCLILILLGFIGFLVIGYTSSLVAPDSDVVRQTLGQPDLPTPPQPKTAEPRSLPAAQPKPTQAQAFAAIQELIEPSPLIHSTAISKGGVAVVVVENGWHYEPKQIRLQLATAIGQRWKDADPEGLGAITFVDIGGNEVGGRGFRGIWVTD